MRIFVLAITLMLTSTMVNNSKPFDQVIRGGSAPWVSADCSLNIVSWNIERGLDLAGVTATLKEMRPAIVLLQEVDLNVRRTGNINIAEHLASSLGMNYLFAVEFEELGQGNRSQSAYHGQAILTNLPTSSARIIRFQNQSGFWNPRWFIPKWSIFQRRTGGRMGLVAEIEMGSQRLIAYDVHLESRGSEELRLLQVKEIIEDVQRYSRDTSIIIAGDFNNRRQDAAAINAMREAGFRLASGGEVTSIHGTDLDWIFVRGPLDMNEGKVYQHVRASDHFPISARIANEMPDCRN